MGVVFSAGSDFKLATKWSPVPPFGVDCKMLVCLAVSDQYSLIGLVSKKKEEIYTWIED